MIVCVVSANLADNLMLWNLGKIRFLLVILEKINIFCLKVDVWILSFQMSPVI